VKGGGGVQRSGVSRRKSGIEGWRGRIEVGGGVGPRARQRQVRGVGGVGCVRRRRLLTEWTV